MRFLKHGGTASLRRFLLTLLALACLAAFTFPGRVHAGESAGQFIERLGGRAMEMLAPDNIDDKERERRFRELFRRKFDYQRITRFVVGRHARRVTGEEMKEFATLYEDRLVFTYARLFASYADYDLVVRRESGEAGGRYRMVATELTAPGGGQPMLLDWQVRADSGNYAVVDLRVEGASMALAHRDEFAALLNKHKGDVSAALVEFRDRIANIRREEGMPLAGH